jgi:CheY-like chemotaxis protein
MITSDAKAGSISFRGEADVAGTPKRILIVDDDVAVRRVLGEVLREEGYTVLEAGVGLNALPSTPNTQIDLVLLDPNLSGDSRWDTFRSLAGMNSRPPIIVMASRVGQRAQATRLKADAFTEKPLNLPSLLKIISRFISESEDQARRRRDAPGFRTCFIPSMGRGVVGRSGPAPGDDPSRLHEPCARQSGRNSLQEDPGVTRTNATRPHLQAPSPGLCR